MANVTVGEIWQVGGSQQLALVIFARDASSGEDVRVVPIYRARWVPLATHRDLVVPNSDNSFGEPILAACWNARGILGSDLDRRVGHVTSRTVEAARNSEMAGILPGLDPTKSLGWEGPRLEDDEAIAIAKSFQLEEVQRWNDIEDSLPGLRNHRRYLYVRGDYQNIRGVVVAGSAAPVTVFGDLSVAIHGTMVIGGSALVGYSSGVISDALISAPLFTWQPSDPQREKPSVATKLAEAA